MKQQEKPKQKKLSVVKKGKDAIKQQTEVGKLGTKIPSTAKDF
jgi:hypothetical protein